MEIHGSPTFLCVVGHKGKVSQEIDRLYDHPQYFVSLHKKTVRLTLLTLYRDLIQIPMHEFIETSCICLEMSCIFLELYHLILIHSQLRFVCFSERLLVYRMPKSHVYNNTHSTFCIIAK